MTGGAAQVTDYSLQRSGSSVSIAARRQRLLQRRQWWQRSGGCSSAAVAAAAVEVAAAAYQKMTAAEKEVFKRKMAEIDEADADDGEATPPTPTPV